MICNHCGKKYSDEFEYCPYCAEPKPKPEKTLDEAYLDKQVYLAKFWSIFGGIVLQLFALICMGPILGLIFGMMLFPVCIWAIIYGVRKQTIEKIQKNSRQTIIDKQYSMDQTSICPACGSHNIKVYRKGYNYKVGFWGAIFGIRGSEFRGGFDADKACCRCVNCGHDWETDYDYRLISD